MIKQEMISRASLAGIELTTIQADRFAEYHKMLLLANERMNLTRISLDDPGEAVDRHYIDSIAPMAEPGLFIGAANMIDVGSGAGLPGIPLAIMLESAHVVLLDSLKKRVLFLSEVISALGLNAEAVHARAEDAARDAKFREQFDVVTARAVAGLNTLVEWTMPFARVGGKLLAYKGPSLNDELILANRAISLVGGGEARVINMPIQGRDWDHRLFILQKVNKTPSKYPRKPAEISKAPL